MIPALIVRNFSKQALFCSFTMGFKKEHFFKFFLSILEEFLDISIYLIYFQRFPLKVYFKYLQCIKFKLISVLSVSEVYIKSIQYRIVLIE